MAYTLHELRELARQRNIRGRSYATTKQQLMRLLGMQELQAAPVPKPTLRDLRLSDAAKSIKGRWKMTRAQLETELDLKRSPPPPPHIPNEILAVIMGYTNLYTRTQMRAVSHRFKGVADTVTHMSEQVMHVMTTTADPAAMFQLRMEYGCKDVQGVVQSICSEFETFEDWKQHILTTCTYASAIFGRKYVQKCTARVRAEVDTKHQDIRALKQGNVAMDKEYRDLLAREHQLTMKTIDLICRKKVNSHSESVDTVSENSEHKMSPSDRQLLEKIAASIDLLKEDVGGLKNDVSGLKEDVGGLKNDVSGLKEDVGGLKNDVRNLTGRMDAVERRLTAVEGFQNGQTIPVPCAKINPLKRTDVLVRLYRLKDRLESRLASETDRRERLSRDLEKVKLRIADLEKTIEDASVPVPCNKEVRHVFALYKLSWDGGREVAYIARRTQLRYVHKSFVKIQEMYGSKATIHPDPILKLTAESAVNILNVFKERATAEKWKWVRFSKTFLKTSNERALLDHLTAIHESRCRE